MGWTSFHKPYGLSIDEIFEREFKGLQFVGKGALVNLTEYYRAVYVPPHKGVNGTNVEGYYICLVALVHMGRGEFNFAYKDMTEDMLPYYFNCPKRILDIVEQSKPCNDNSKLWRERCHDVINRKKLLDYGKVIKFKEPFDFNGGYREDTFTIINGNRYGKRKTMKLQSYHHGFTARIPKWKSMDFEIL